MSRHTPDQQDEMNFVSPEDALILELRPEAWPGTRRVKIHVTLTPHLEPLSLAAEIVNKRGEKMAEIDIIGTPDESFVFTMHLPDGNPAGEYCLQARLYSQDETEYHHKKVNFELE